jgi:predicted CxxxxCH...CXXCH cytochrome family protein
MKIRNLYKIAGVMLLFVILQSRSGGPGSSDQKLQVTGAPNSTGMSVGQPGTCANSGCHSSGQFNPSMSIALMDDTAVVNKYEPGKTYTVRITTIPGVGSPQRYGFQAVALSTANQQAGDWDHTNLPLTIQRVTLSNRNYAEHTGPSSLNTFKIPWIAPAAGFGDVIFYAAGIASNNNGNTSGDGTAKATLTVKEGPASGVTNTTKEYAALKVIPNPVAEILNLEITGRQSGEFKLRFLSVGGEVMKIEPVSLSPGFNRKSFGVDDLLPGLYILQLCGTDHVAAVQMLKL